MQHVPHAHARRVRHHDEAQVRGRLVVVQLVLAGAVRDEGVVVAAELADHVAEGEDGTEDQLRIVGGAAGVGGGVGLEPGLCVDAFGWGSLVLEQSWWAGGMAGEGEGGKTGSRRAGELGME